MDIDITIRNLLAGEAADSQIELMLDEGKLEKFRGFISKHKKKLGTAGGLAAGAAVAYGAYKAYKRHQLRRGILGGLTDTERNVMNAAREILRGVSRHAQNMTRSRVQDAATNAFRSRTGWGWAVSLIPTVIGIAFQRLEDRLSEEPTDEELDAFAEECIRELRQTILPRYGGRGALRVMLRTERARAQLVSAYNEARALNTQVGGSLDLYLLIHRSNGSTAFEGISAEELYHFWQHEMGLDMTGVPRPEGATQ